MSTTSSLRHAEETGLPVISQHAHEKWDQRMPDDAVAAETALEAAARLTDVALHGHWERNPDPPAAIWVFRGLADGRAYTAAFIERRGTSTQSTITTVLRPAKMAHKPMAAYLRAAGRGGYDE